MGKDDLDSQGSAPQFLNGAQPLIVGLWNSNTKLEFHTLFPVISDY